MGFTETGMDTAKRVIRVQHGHDRFNGAFPFGAKKLNRPQSVRQGHCGVVVHV